MNKKIAPIIIFIIFFGYLLLTFFGLMQSPIQGLSGFEFSLVLLLGLFIVYIAIAMIVTLIKRLKEIDQEDKDDLSKY